MNNKSIGIVLVVVVAVALGGYLLLSNKANTTPDIQNNNTKVQTQETAQPMEKTTVRVTTAGYEPQTITVKAGSTVVWTNESGATSNVSSDVHPTHLLWKFLNLGNFDDGSSVSVKFEKAGEYTYHSHLDASQKGTVIVE